MQTVQEMLSTTPNRTMTGESVLDECIEACAECALACTVCADACLGERKLEQLRACIRLNQDCADACNVTARVLSRQLQGDMEFLSAQLEACALACAACGAECRAHAAHHEHCRLCADACRRCELQCRAMIQALARMRT